MTAHPVLFRVDRAAHNARIHVLIRFVLLLAVGAVGCTSLYWILYLGLPPAAALLIANLGPERYLLEQAPPVARILRWFAAAYAYLWMLTDSFPVAGAEGPVELWIQPGGTPTTRSAVLRVVYSLPALLLLAVLSFAAGLLWVVGAVCILVRERLPDAIADFLELTLRYQFRLAAYHLSLVDEYPSLEQAGPVPAPPPAA